MVPPSVLQLGQFIIVQNNLSNNDPLLYTLTKTLLFYVILLYFILYDHVMSLTLCTTLRT